MMTHFTPEYYEQQYNNRAAAPEHPRIIARWVSESEQVRAAACKTWLCQAPIISPWLKIWGKQTAHCIAQRWR